MTIRETMDYVELLGHPFTEIYELVMDYMMEDGEDSAEGMALAEAIEGVFTEFADERNGRR
ncbi:MAG TPA: hypothetical protein VMX17_05775 [Candidatus Glassbacteria bacterium]|nr:hypothetical protein [Candidatus Glassbacteria bacterium]